MVILLDITACCSFKLWKVIRNDRSTITHVLEGCLFDTKAPWQLIGVVHVCSVELRQAHNAPHFVEDIQKLAVYNLQALDVSCILYISVDGSKLKHAIIGSHAAHLVVHQGCHVHLLDLNCANRR